MSQLTMTDLHDLLAANGFKLKRRTKRFVYSDGKNTFMVPSNASDSRAAMNQYHKLKRIVRASGREFQGR